MVETGEIENTTEARMLAAKAYKLKVLGNPYMSGRNYFTEDEFEVWAESIREYSRMGFPFNAAQVRDLMRQAVREQLDKDKAEGLIQGYEEEDIPNFGEKFMKR